LASSEEDEIPRELFSFWRSHQLNKTKQLRPQPVRIFRRAREPSRKMSPTLGHAKHRQMNTLTPR
jgi:hypothetical protein